LDVLDMGALEHRRAVGCRHQFAAAAFVEDQGKPDDEPHLVGRLSKQAIEELVAPDSSFLK